MYQSKPEKYEEMVVKLRELFTHYYDKNYEIDELCKCLAWLYIQFYDNLQQIIIDINMEDDPTADPPRQISDDYLTALEAYLGIKTDKSLPVSTRRAQIITIYQDKIPYTIIRFAKIVDNYIKDYEHTITEDFENRVVKIFIEDLSIDLSSLDYMKSYLRKIVPAHIKLLLELDYMRHIQIKNYPYKHGDLVSSTHFQIRNKQIQPPLTSYLTITTSAATTIDLSMLTGLTSVTNWGDAKTLKGLLGANPALTHSYSKKGTYRIIGDFENVTAIGNYFLSNNNITNVSFYNFEKVTSIGNDFLSENNLTGFNFSSIPNATTVGNNFLYNNKNENLNITGSNKIKTIGNNFCCTNVDNTLNIANFSALTTIGSMFCGNSDNTKTKTVVYGDIFSNVTTAGEKILYQCNLSTLDLSRFSNNCLSVNYFCYNCNITNTVDFTPINSRNNSIGQNFLAGSNISQINFNQISGWHTIPNGFLAGCSNITNVDLSPLTNITAIGNNFGDGWQTNTINIKPMTALTSIGTNFLNNNSVKNLTVPTITIPTLGSWGNCLTQTDSIIWCDGKLAQYVDANVWKEKMNIMTGDLSELPITLSGSQTIDLSMLNGLDDVYIDWGDGTITKSGVSHTYADGGEYVIKAMFNDVTSIGNDFMKDCTNLTNIDLSGLSNVSNIGNNFLYNTGLTSVDLSDMTNVSSIGDNFVSGNDNLTNIDLSGLTGVTTIGDNFLIDDPNLTNINLTGLDNVETIGDRFLYSYKGTSIDLTPLGSVESVGDYFLGNCTQLNTIDTSPMESLLYIGDYFLYNCSGATSVDLGGLTNVAEIGDNFLCGYQGNDDVFDLSDLANVTTIGNNFMNDCRYIKEVDMSNMTNLESIGDDFLAGCTNLQKLDVPQTDPPTLDGWGDGLDNLDEISCGERLGDYLEADGWKDKADIMTGVVFPTKEITITIGTAPQTIDLSMLTGLDDSCIVWDTDVYTESGKSHTYTTPGTYTIKANFDDITDIGDNFLYNKGITNIDFGDMTNVASIGDNFLGNNSMTTFNASKLSNVDTIGDNFLIHNSGLTTLNLSPIIKITTIPNNFVNSCDNLTSITLPNANITSVENSFLFDNPKLNNINLTPLSNATSIGDSFLAQCGGLTTLNLAPLTKVETIGDNFLTESDGITTLDMTPMTSLDSIGDNFLNNTNITTLKVPTINPVPTLSGWGDELALTDIQCDTSLKDYKVADVWKEKSNIMTGKTVTSIEIKTTKSNVSVQFTGMSGLTLISDWGDESTPTTTLSHTFTNAGTYTIWGDFSNVTKINGIPSEFIEKIDLSNLDNLTELGDNALGSTSTICKLKNIILPDTGKITKVGKDVFSYCNDMTSIDLTPLRNVTSIGNNFLCGYFVAGDVNPSLQTIDLTPLTKLTTIGNYFLKDQTKLTQINLSTLTSLTSIGTYLLNHCEKLTTIDMSNLNSLTSIGQYFLNYCTALTTLNVPLVDPPALGSWGSGLTKLTKIECDEYLEQYEVAPVWLEKKSIMTGIRPVKINITVNAGTTIDLSPLNGFTKIINWGDSSTPTTSKSHTYSSAGTYTIKGDFDKVTSIGERFLHINYGVTALDISELSNLTNIGNGFILNNSSFSSLVLPNNITTIGDNFLAGTGVLFDVDLSPLSNVTTVGNSFMSYSGVTTLDMSKMTRLTSIGNNFLSHSGGLVTLIVPQRTPPTLGGWGSNYTMFEVIECNDYVEQYEVAPVWSEKADLMSGYIEIKFVKDTSHTNTTVTIDGFTGASYGQTDWGDGTIDNEKTHTYTYTPLKTTYKIKNSAFNKATEFNGTLNIVGGDRTNSMLKSVIFKGFNKLKTINSLFGSVNGNYAELMFDISGMKNLTNIKYNIGDSSMAGCHIYLPITTDIITIGNSKPTIGGYCRIHCGSNLTKYQADSKWSTYNLLE